MKQRDEAINAFRLIGRLGVERRAHSCIGKFCMSLIQIQRYKYQQSLKEIIWQKVSVRKKKSWTYHCCLLDSPDRHILLSNYVARIWKCYLLNVVNCPSIMENSWIESSEMQCLGWWCLSTRYYENLVWWRFWQRKHGTRIRSSRWLYYWKYWWLKLQFHLVYTLITIPRYIR